MVFPSREGEMSDTPEMLVKGLGKRPEEVYLSRDYMAVFELVRGHQEFEIRYE